MSANVDAAKSKVKQEAGAVTHNRWVEGLARFGYVVRGLLYIVVGILAVQVAFGAGGATTDKKGAIEVIGAQPFGKFLLVIMLVGLVGYSLWGLVRAFLDPLKRGTKPKGLAQRAGYLVSALAYGSLIAPTFSFIQGGGQSGGSQGSPDLTAKLLSVPFGQWLVAIFGLVGMVGGLGQMWLAVTADFEKDLKTGEMSANEVSGPCASGASAQQRAAWSSRCSAFSYCKRRFATTPSKRRASTARCGLSPSSPMAPGCSLS